MIDPAAPDYTRRPVRTHASFHYAPADRMGPPVLSVITPPTTDPARLPETAASLLAQSLQGWEWLVAVSSDEDSARLNSLRDEARIRVLPGASVRTCLDEARAELVLLLHAGDLIEPTAAEKWMWFLASRLQYDFVDSYHVVFGERGRLDPPPAGHLPPARPTGIVRRTALADLRADALDGDALWGYLSGCVQRATLPEYLHWHRSEGAPHDAPTPSVRRRVHRQRQAVDAGIELEHLPFENPLWKKRRRLLLLVPWMITGGAEKFNLDLIEQLTHRDWEITVATTLPARHTWAARHTQLTPDVFVLQYLIRAGDYPRFLRYVIASRQPDVILIANSEFAYRALPYIRRHAAGAAIADYCHSVVTDWLDGGYPRLSVERQGLLDLNITSSGYLRQWMADEGADRNRIEVCYTNVREDERGPDLSAPPHGLPDDRPLILYPCRVDVEKQPAVFARTLLELRRGGHAFAGVVAGDGPYLGWLERFVKKEGLAESVYFLGRQPNDRIRQLMARSACVFLPSEYEGISLAFFEAMAEGVPVVGADVGGQAELVTADCGVLIQRGDESEEVERYSRVIGDLLEHPEKRQAMGAAARRRIREHFQLDQMGDRMNSLLEQARERARTDPRPVPTVEAARGSALAAIRALPADSRPGQPSGLVFAAAQAVGMPVHRLALKLGLHGVEGLRRRVVNLLQPKEH